MRFLKFTSALAIAAAAFAMPASAQQQTYNVGAAVYGLKGEFMQLWANALREHPLVKNGTVNVTVYDGNYDALTQNNQFETMITRRMDGILFVPIDIQAGAEAVSKAAEANIPVVGSNTRVNSDLLAAYVGSNDVIAGEMVAESVISRMGGQGNVVILEGPIGQSAQIERRKGIENVLAKYPNVRVLEMRTANWSRAEAMTLMENWLTQHGANINGIIGQNDEMALGAIEAVKARGIDPKTLPTGGVDGVRDAILAVQAGNMTSVLQDAKAQAQGALDVLLGRIIGSSYVPQSPIWAQYQAAGLQWNGGTEANYSIPWTPITTENADALLAGR